MPLKILLADDSVTAQNMGKKILTDAGHEVVAVSNGAAASKKLNERFDVFILDVFMPGYSGLEICEKIRASMDSAKTPVLLTVGKMEPYNPQDGQRVKADGVIIKPFEASDLLAAVQKLGTKAAEARVAEAAKAAKAEKPDYEKTMVFKVPPAAKDFQDETYHGWKADAPQHKEAHEPEEQEMPVEAAPPPMPISDPGVPAFAMDDSASFATSSNSGAAVAPAMEVSAAPAFEMPESAPGAEVSAAPAFAIDDTPAAGFDLNAAPPSSTVSFPAPAAGFDLDAAPSDATVTFSAPAMPSFDIGGESAPAEAPPAFSMDFAAPTGDAPSFIVPGMEEVSSTAVEPPSVPEMLEPTSAEPVAIAPATAPDVEFTAAAKVGAIEVQVDPSLDTHMEAAPSGVISMSGPDPALVTDPHEMAQEFTTKFGVENDTDPVVVGTVMAPEEIAAAAVEAAPVEESAVAEVVETSEQTEQATAGETQEMTAVADEPPAEEVSVPEVEAASAVAEEQAAEVPSYVADVYSEEEESQPMAVAEAAAAVEPEAVAETVVEPETVEIAEAADAEPAADPHDPNQPPEGMLDAAMVEQLQAAVADMQLQEHPAEDHAEPEAVAAAPEPEVEAAAIPAATVDESHNTELANALAASLGDPAPMAMAAAASSSGVDPIIMTNVVNKVLERMLPMILAQIAAEMDQLKK